MKKMMWVALASLVTLAWTASAEMRIATVDLDRVFTSHPKTQKAEESLKNAEERIKGDMEKMVEEARALDREVQELRDQSKSVILTEAARVKKNLEAEEKLTQLQELQLRIRRTQETRLKQLREQLMKTRQGIVDELMGLVKTFAEEEGYDLILDRSGLTMNAVPLVAYSDPALDVTDTLIGRIGGTVAK